MDNNITELKKIYAEVKETIENRLKEFDELRKSAPEDKLFIELSFCLLTPQSKAKSAWTAINNMLNDKILFSAAAEDISGYLNIVRFKNNKSRYIVEAREKFAKNGSFDIRSKIVESDLKATRMWFADNVKGIGMKEAGHYLRNIGYGQKLAILDRHILKNLVRYNVIDELPKSLSKGVYLDIENKMEKFSEEIGIPMDCLDFLFWYMEAGEVFK